MSDKAQYGSAGGWSGSGILKNDGQSNKGMAANFLERSNNEIPSKNYTVQFSVGSTKNSATGQIVNQAFINPVGVITWSVNGNSVRRVVSVINGMSITGVGEGVKVVVTDRTPQPIIGEAVEYDIDITVAPGSRASVTQPPTYCPTLETQEGMIEVSGGGTFDIAVPQNAGVISVYITAVDSTGKTPLTTLLARIDQVSSTGAVVRQYDPNANYPSVFVPIMPTCTKITLVNNQPVSEANAILFAVTFGIDG